MSPIVRGCLRKRATFPDTQQAWQAIWRWEAMGRIPPDTLKPYDCPVGGHVHVKTKKGH